MHDTHYRSSTAKQGVIVTNQQHGDYTTCVRQHTDSSDVRVYTSQADACDSVWSPLQSSKFLNTATDLALSSWRDKSTRSYNSSFNKWARWCAERDRNPISGSISDVANFLADLFEEGYQYRSINVYRSSISTTHDKVDGYSVGQHPTVTRLMRGVFNKRPPLSKYSYT